MPGEVWVCSSCKKRNSDSDSSAKWCRHCRSFREDIVITRQEAELIYQEFAPAVEEVRLDMGEDIFRRFCIEFYQLTESLKKRENSALVLPFSHSLVKTALTKSRGGAVAMLYFIGYELDFGEFHIDPAVIAPSAFDSYLTIIEKVMAKPKPTKPTNYVSRYHSYLNTERAAAEKQRAEAERAKKERKAIEAVHAAAFKQSGANRGQLSSFYEEFYANDEKYARQQQQKQKKLASATKSGESRRLPYLPLDNISGFVCKYGSNCDNFYCKDRHVDGRRPQCPYVECTDLNCFNIHRPEIAHPNSRYEQQKMLKEVRVVTGRPAGPRTNPTAMGNIACLFDEDGICRRFACPYKHANKRVGDCPYGADCPYLLWYASAPGNTKNKDRRPHPERCELLHPVTARRGRGDDVYIMCPMADVCRDFHCEFRHRKQAERDHKRAAMEKKWAAKEEQQAAQAAVASSSWASGASAGVMSASGAGSASKVTLRTSEYSPDDLSMIVINMGVENVNIIEDGPYAADAHACPSAASVATWPTWSAAAAGERPPVAPVGDFEAQLAAALEASKLDAYPDYSCLDAFQPTQARAPAPAAPVPAPASSSPPPPLRAHASPLPLPTSTSAPAAASPPLPMPLPLPRPKPLPTAIPTVFTYGHSGPLPVPVPMPVPVPISAASPLPLPVPSSSSIASTLAIPAPAPAPAPTTTPSPLPLPAPAHVSIQTAPLPLPMASVTSGPAAASVSSISPLPLPIPSPVASPTPAALSIPKPASATSATSASSPVPLPLPVQSTARSVPATSSLPLPAAPLPIPAPSSGSFNLPLPLPVKSATPAAPAVSSPLPLPLPAQSAPLLPIPAPSNVSSPLPLPAVSIPAASKPAPAPAIASTSAPAPAPAAPATTFAIPMSTRMPMPMPMPVPTPASVAGEMDREDTEEDVVEGAHVPAAGYGEDAGYGEIAGYGDDVDATMPGYGEVTGYGDDGEEGGDSDKAIPSYGDTDTTGANMPSSSVSPPGAVQMPMSGAYRADASQLNMVQMEYMQMQYMHAQQQLGAYGGGNASGNGSPGMGMPGMPGMPILGVGFPPQGFMPISMHMPGMSGTPGMPNMPIGSMYPMPGMPMGPDTGKRMNQSTPAGSQAQPYMLGPGYAQPPAPENKQP